ncbi:hypothetical protein TRICI_001653 [Trichomonascus ciferrii]|uniref:Uncharacterized protein n=1 Tax=Trichomonascus ciferrii TaxID=44093 RepID=A0A642V7U8_9ASCO|nr:hypothetical protein TRICI_001653 [Trichomonascus ciferrii]
MSRRSLYRHSGRHQSSYAVDVDEKIVHWGREWVTPQLSQAQQQAQQTQAQSQANTPGPEDAKNTNGSAATTAASAATRDFKIKAWVPIDESTYQPVEDGEPDDVLDMQSSETKVILPEPEPEQAGGLTAADIRGAVGGDAIPGIVSQQYSDNKPEQQPQEDEEKKPNPSNDPDVSMEEAPAS